MINLFLLIPIKYHKTSQSIAWSLIKRNISNMNKPIYNAIDTVTYIVKDG